MSFQITYIEKEKIIEVKLLVDLNWPIILQIVPIVSRLIRDKGCDSILLDFRNINLDLSTVGMFQTPEKLREEFEKHGVNLMLIKRALLISSYDEDHHFFETVMVNRGHLFSLFLKRDEAIAWLGSK